MYSVPLNSPNTPEVIPFVGEMSYYFKSKKVVKVLFKIFIV